MLCWSINTKSMVTLTKVAVAHDSHRWLWCYYSSPVILRVFPLQRQCVPGERVVVGTVHAVNLLVFAEHVVGVPAVGAVVQLEVLETRVSVQGGRVPTIAFARVPRLQLPFLRYSD
jgi:hypothetical protein